MSDPSEQPGPNLFGWKTSTPGRYLAIIVVVGLFALLLLLGWAFGSFSCSSFAACPWLRR